VNNLREKGFTNRISHFAEQFGLGNREIIGLIIKVGIELNRD
jgi:hypothetical protein